MSIQILVPQNDADTTRSGSGALKLVCTRLCLFAGDGQLSDAVPPAAWHRRVGQLVIVIIDALRADFVLDHPSKVRIQ